LFQTLLIADVRQYLVENGDTASFRCRDMQAALRHQTDQPRRLQRDGLSASIWASDYKQVEGVAEANIDWDNGSRLGRFTRLG
jgi:hypothetical protein